MEPLTEQFHQAMLTTYHTAKNKHGYNATYFMQMISEFGGETAHWFLASANPAAGLTTLWECGRLDLIDKPCKSGTNTGYCTRASLCHFYG